jgi:hypothetical protein
MKTKIKTAIKSVICLCFAVLATGCDLQVQEKFVFDDQVEPQVTFGTMNAWEWIQTNPKGEFTYMKQAIELTGLQSTYSNMTDKRTFFLLKDLAWTKVPGIMSVEFPGATSLVDPKVNIDKLRNILLYHTITTYVDQGPDNLVTLDKDYPYNSLYTGTKLNIVTIRRDRNYIMVLNQSPALIPSILRKGGSVKLHNYIFSNGNSVAHILEDYIKNEAFKSVP